MKIALGADHAGFCLREDLAGWLSSEGYEVKQYGAESSDPYDYPDAADLVCREILDNRADFGVLVCGSGIGVDIRSNRYEHIRAANCLTTEMAALSREHNHANVLCLGSRLVATEKAKEIVATFLATGESTEARHVRRVEKMDSDVSMRKA